MAEIQSEFISLSIADEKTQENEVSTFEEPSEPSGSSTRKRPATSEETPETSADWPNSRRKKRMRRGEPFRNVEQQYTPAFWSSARKEVLDKLLNQLMETSNRRVFVLPSCSGIPLTQSLSYEENLFESDNCLSDPFLNCEMEQIEEDLNSVKAIVGTMEPTTWNSLTNYTDLASSLRYAVKINEEIELGTNAWLKFWSILHAYPQLADFPSDSLSVHLCEAPGAFVSALNQYLFVKNPAIHQKWDWLASSLNPYVDLPNKEAIVDDRLIKCTTEKWHFGADGTGNLKSAANRASLVKTTLASGKKVHLVTADGGIDCSDDPALQESTLASLKIAETLTALRLLTPGGHFVLKIFTTFRKRMSQLLKFLCSTFEQVHLYKPPTSKPGNSEIYVVCLGFRQEPSVAVAAYLDRMMIVSTQLDEILDPAFMQHLMAASRFFAQSQSAAIRMNLAVFSTQRNRRLRTCFHEAKQKFSATFRENSPFGSLTAKARLLSTDTEDE